MLEACAAAAWPSSSRLRWEVVEATRGRKHREIQVSPPVFQINVRVTTMDAELEFAIQPNTTGKQLFDQVSLRYRDRELTTHEKWVRGQPFDLLSR